MGPEFNITYSLPEESRLQQELGHDYLDHWALIFSCLL